MIIYFRVCEKQQTISNVIRFQQINKTDMIRRCWKALQSSVTHEDIIFIIHDAVSEDTLEWLQNTANTSNIHLVAVEPHSWDYHLHTITLFSVLEEQCIKYPNELHYILEDDYLHVPNALSVIKNTLSGWQHFAVSYDSPDRYTLNPEPCMVILGYDRHWRTINSSTMTLIAKGSTWLKWMPEFKQAAPSSNDQVSLSIFTQEPCVSPLPGLSSHMTQHHITPLVDWSDIWNSQNV
jgi:hypothetical protein